MITHDGLDIAAVFVIHLVSDTRAAMIRRDEPDTDTDIDTDTADVDDPTITVTATASATPNGNAASATTNTTGNSTLSTGAGSSSGVHLDQGVKAGIAIGVIVGVFFIAGAIFMIGRRCLRNRRAKRLAAQNSNNPHLVVAGNMPPPGGAGDGAPGYVAEEKRSTMTTTSEDGGGRPWFDTGAGSTELEAGGGRRVFGPPMWVTEKAELPTPRRDRTAELPDAVGTRFEPVELPALVPLMPEDRDEGDVADRLGMAGMWRSGSQRTWTGTMSSLQSGTLVSSPTGTTSTEEGHQVMISPCSTGSDYNRAGKTGV